MTSDELLAKAQRAVESARLLLAADDPDGACNRAYYAMFDAARAALLASGAPVPAEVARTHSGLIASFSLHLVKTGQIEVSFGRALNKVEELRLVADYKGDQISMADSSWAFDQAQSFVEQIRLVFFAGG